MSVQAMSWVLDHCPQSVPSSARCVLMAIANHSGRHGEECWPSLATIAREAGMSERSAQRHIGWLERHGYLEVQLRAGGSRDCPGDRRPNLYRIVPFCEMNPHPNHGVTTVSPRRPDNSDTTSGCQVVQNEVTSEAPRGDNSVTQTVLNRPEPSFPMGVSPSDDDSSVGGGSSSEDADIYRRAARIVTDLKAGVKDRDAYASGIALRMAREREGLLAGLRRSRPDLDAEGLARWVAQGDNPFGDPDDYWLGLEDAS